MIELFSNFVNVFLHLDTYLVMVINAYGAWVYALMFLVIFVETGVVILPFLPGDSLLFAAGALAASTTLKIWWLWPLMWLAATLGDTVNYWIGHRVGTAVFRPDSRWFRQEYLEKTRNFYAKHGNKTIFLARFFPLLRTFAPFVAGVGRMDYGKFLSYNIFGGAIWTALFLFGGYFFGNITAVKDNFELVIIAIIAISLLPAVIEYWRYRQPPASVVN